MYYKENYGVWNRNAALHLFSIKKIEEHHWYCNKCKKSFSIIKASFFSEMEINVRFGVLVMWNCALFLKGVQFSLGNLFFVLYVASYLSFIGGEGHFVQIDEMVVTKREYSREQLVAERWVIGIYDTNATKCFIEYIANRSATTCHKTTCKNILRNINQ